MQRLIQVIDRAANIASDVNESPGDFQGKVGGLYTDLVTVKAKVQQAIDDDVAAKKKAEDERLAAEKKAAAEAAKAAEE